VRSRRVVPLVPSPTRPHRAESGGVNLSISGDGGAKRNYFRQRIAVYRDDEEHLSPSSASWLVALRPLFDRRSIVPVKSELLRSPGDLNRRRCPRTPPCSGKSDSRVAFSRCRPVANGAEVELSRISYLIHLSAFPAQHDKSAAFRQTPAI
jgi:hypothetical protein